MIFPNVNGTFTIGAHRLSFYHFSLPNKRLTYKNSTQGDLLQLFRYSSISFSISIQDFGIGRLQQYRMITALQRSDIAHSLLWQRATPGQKIQVPMRFGKLQRKVVAQQVPENTSWAFFTRRDRSESKTFFLLKPASVCSCKNAPVIL